MHTPTYTLASIASAIDALSLWQVDVFSEKKGLVIVGYYHANQRLDDNRYTGMDRL